MDQLIRAEEEVSEGDFQGERRYITQKDSRGKKSLRWDGNFKENTDDGLGD